ncbi:MAG: T9SS type A sorting domain-containing protein [Bacteroidetes bacterium]|nr:T9SS type A sorting domain-containing protein [Bacteroidota bacterium]
MNYRTTLILYSNKIITALMLLVFQLGFGQVSADIKSGVPVPVTPSSTLTTSKSWTSAALKGHTPTSPEITTAVKVQAALTNPASFIKNMGQYGATLKGYESLGAIKYGYEGLDMPVLLTDKGIIHLHREYKRISHAEEEKLEKQGIREEEIERRLTITDRVITAEWLDANPEVEIIAAEKTTDYHTYGMLQEKAFGYKKIIYRNLYPGIDLVYSFSATSKPGFEYSLLVKPGANLSAVKLKYGGDIQKIKTDRLGNLIIRSDIDGISCSVPVSYYGESLLNQATAQIKTEYHLSGTEVSFSFPEGYDHNQALVIDPFVTSTSNLTGVNAGKAIDVDFDYNGNVYVAGGGSLVTSFAAGASHQHAKYNSAGVLEWTFNGVLTIPSWQADFYYGGWVVDKATGNLYIGQGYATNGFRVIRLNTTGLYDNYISTGDPAFQEAWKMYWVCNSGSPQIICAGGGTTGPTNFAYCAPPATALSAAVNLTGSSAIGQDMTDLIVDPVTNSLYTIYASPLDPSTGNKLYKTNPPYSAASTAWSTATGYPTVINELANRPYLATGYNDNSSNILAQNATYVFYWDGQHLEAFNKTTGAIAGTPVTIATNTLLMQGGIVADACNNVYIGNTNGTIKVYQFNGTTFNDAAAPDISIAGYNTNVYDLALDESKKLLYASGNGFVASVDITAYCPATIYTVTAVPNCATASASVSISPAPPADATVTYVLFSGTTQLATINTTATTPAVFTGLSPNVTYTVVATVNSACSGTQATTTFILPGPTITFTQTNTTCGANTGAINAVGSGSAGPYNYSLDGGAFQASGIFSGLAAGVHTLMVQGSGGCPNSSTVNILNSNGPNISFTQTNATCGNNSGTVTTSVTGGTAPYQYSMTGTVSYPYQTGNFFTGLVAGSYVLTVKDAANCTNSALVTIATSPAIVFNAIPASATCGQNNGTITAFGSGGTNPLEYSINGNTFQAGNIFNNVSPGNYTVYVRDAIGCTSSVTVTVDSNPLPSITATTTNAACGNINGTITASGSGGVAPLQYSINGTTFQTSPLFSGLSAGSYTVTVKDASGCIATTTALVGSTGGPSASGTSTPASCSTANGTITITPTGIGPFTYSINGTTYQSSNIFTSVAAGNYFVFVRDAQGCTGAALVVVNPVAGPSITAVSTPAACTVNNGTITATGTGGAAPLQYSIDGVTYSASNSFTNLAPNTYTVYVKDANGCIKTTSITVNNASGLSLTLSAISSSCGNTGIITATAGGGVAPLQYNINSGAYQASNIFSGLAPGTYTVNVKDANNCIVTKQAVIASLTGLSLSASVVLQGSCASNNAVIMASGSGGSAPLTYSINGTTYQSSGTFLNVAAGTYTVYLKDATGCIVTQSGLVVTNTGSGPGISTFTFTLKDALVCDGTLGKIQNFKVNGASCSSCTFSLDFGPFLTGNNYTNISPGQHYVIAKDASGCTKVVPFTVNDTNGATATVAVIGSPCGSSTGQITLTGTNGSGSPPYHYSTDNGLTWSQFNTSVTLTGYAPGNYTILMADDSGFDPDPPGPNCVTTLTVVVPATTGSPTLSVNSTNESCNLANGTITAVGSGGSGAPFSYSIDGNPYDTSGDFSGLSAGTYSISVMDSAGCIKTSTVTITNTGGPSLSVLTSDTSCGLSNGMITVIGSGGSAPYQYSLNGTVYQTSNLFNNLPADVYTVYIKDAVGCVNTSTEIISVGSIPIVTAFTAAATCSNSDGALFVVGSQGLAPYQFSLNGTVYQSNNVFTGLPAGFYTVYLKDDRGCVVTSGVTLGNLSAASFTTSVVAASCGAQNGSITVTATGGTLPYTYSFDGGLTFGSSNTSGLLFPGNYTVVLHDGNGCLTTRVVLVNDTIGPQSLTAVVYDASCGFNNGSIMLTVIGGTPNYEYSSDDITYQTDNILSGLGAGTYTVWVRDANGCKTSLIVTLLDLQGATITATATSTSCGLSDGTITVTISGGTVPFQYSIDGGATYQSSNIFTGLGEGTYYVMVLDGTGCPSNVASTDVLVTGGSSTPTIYCGTTSASSITFDWDALAGATDYEVSYQVNAAAPITIGSVGNVLTYTVTGLNENDVVIITVTPTGSSGACFIAATATCTASVCTHPTANFGPDQNICNHGTATFSVTLTGTAPWSLTYSDGSTTTTINNINTNPYVFSVTDITADATYTLTALSDAGCTAGAADMTGAAAVTVINGTPGLWTGLVSTDWFDCRNWAGGLPSATIDAQIPSGAVRMPLIDPATSPFAILYSNIADAQDLIIGATASVTMTANSDLYVSRDWKNSGTFIPGQGTVSFTGATPNQIQTINAGIKTNETFYNLTLNTSNGAKGVSLANGYELTVANLLSLQSGDIRLTGEAQILQSGSVANPTTGTGKIYRDQQGTRSSFNYNYWSSPVSENGLDYTIGDVLRDGSDVTTNPFAPGLINFGAGPYFADGALSSPINLSEYWLYKYTSVSTVYAGWQFAGSTGNIKVGEGFTMKGTDGTANITDAQNYVFAGKPNNGNIFLNIAPNQLYLIGNPYPSALDADEFIKDNIKDGAGRNSTNVINGALSFWNHFAGQTHILASYIGGYATYTLMGGAPAISNNVLINHNGAIGTLTPQRYIPVGQGFFVGTVLDPTLVTVNPNLTTAVTGGPIVLKNSQRAFQVESAAQSVFMRSHNTTATSAANADLRPKIRMRFDSPDGLHRQLLVGADPQTTDLFDLGYDAVMMDVNNDDMYWSVSNHKFVIQAVADFNLDRILPLGLKISNPGEATIKIDALENIPEATEVYLLDNTTGIYHNLKNGSFTVTLAAGDYDDRFSVRFTTETLGTDDFASGSLLIQYTNLSHSLNIQNKDLQTIVEKVFLYNLLGQRIALWEVENKKNIQIPVPHISQGTYLVKVKTSNGVVSKKIMVY